MQSISACGVMWVSGMLVEIIKEWKDYTLLPNQICKITGIHRLLQKKKKMSSLSLWARFNPEAQSLPACCVVPWKILNLDKLGMTTHEAQNGRSRLCGKMSFRLLVSSRPLDGGCICGQTRQAKAWQDQLVRIMRGKLKVRCLPSL